LRRFRAFFATGEHPLGIRQIRLDAGEVGS
jgi:hypothetical protein